VAIFFLAAAADEWLAADDHTNGHAGHGQTKTQQANNKKHHDPKSSK
jgi:hypothetical protein